MTMAPARGRRSAKPRNAAALAAASTVVMRTLSLGAREPSRGPHRIGSRQSRSLLLFREDIPLPLAPNRSSCNHGAELATQYLLHEREHFAFVVDDLRLRVEERILHV